MADPAAAEDVNPFDQLNSELPIGAAPQQAEVPEVNPFAQFNSEKPIPETPDTSITGALLHHAARAAVPALASLPAAGLGAELGAAAGTAIEPGGGTLVGGLLGGAAAFMGSSYALSQAQDYGLSKLPDSWKDKLGLSDEQQAKEEAEHPIASFIGGLLPFALTIRPGAIPEIKLPPNATAMQRLWANPVTQRLFPATIMGGMELGQEKVEGQPADWQKVGIATGFGLVFNRPTRLGERISEAGGVVGRRVTGAPEPTVAQAADAKVMGPGVTEQVFQGAHDQDPSSESAAQSQARAEQTATASPDEDVHAAARRMHPELFAHYDDLQVRESMLRAWIPELEARGEEPVSARYHLAATEKELSDLTPEVAAANRRAADALGINTLAPEGQFRTMAEMLAAQGPENIRPQPPAGEATAAPQGKPLAQQREDIAADATRQYLGAGEPPERAQVLGNLTAERYVQIAQRFNGAIGSAEDIYRREGPTIRGATGAATPEPAATPPVAPVGEAAEAPIPAAQKRARGPAAMPEQNRSLLQFIGGRGGIRNDDALINDLRGSIGKDNQFVPGFGPLIRPYKQVSTAGRAARPLSGDGHRPRPRGRSRGGLSTGRRHGQRFPRSGGPRTPWRAAIPHRYAARAAT